jgi:hypothetical protein
MLLFRLGEGRDSSSERSQPISNLNRDLEQGAGYLGKLGLDVAVATVAMVVVVVGITHASIIGIRKAPNGAKLLQAVGGNGLMLKTIYTFRCGIPARA